MDNFENWVVYRQSMYNLQFPRQQRVPVNFLSQRLMRSKSCLAHSWSSVWLLVAVKGLFGLQTIPGWKQDDDCNVDEGENLPTMPMTPTFLSPQSAMDSSQRLASFPVSQCALWITCPAKVSRPSMSGQSQRLRAPTPVNKTSAVSWNSSQSS